MFVFSVKMNRRRAVSVLIGAVAVIAVAVTALCFPPAQSTVGNVPKLSVSTAEERVALLRELGYEVSGDETVQEIRLPDEPDAVLSAYEELQSAGGLSLLKYSGKRVKLYTYSVTELNSTAKMQVHLYVYRNRVIAGDVTAADPDGTQSPLFA